MIIKEELRNELDGIKNGLLVQRAQVDVLRLELLEKYRNLSPEAKEGVEGEILLNTSHLLGVGKRILDEALDPIQDILAVT